MGVAFVRRLGVSLEICGHLADPGSSTPQLRRNREPTLHRWRIRSCLSLIRVVRGPERRVSECGYLPAPMSMPSARRVPRSATSRVCHTWSLLSSAGAFLSRSVHEASTLEALDSTRAGAVLSAHVGRPHAATLGTLAPNRSRHDSRRLSAHTHTCERAPTAPTLAALNR